VCIAKLDELFFQINVFTCDCRRLQRQGNLLPLIGKHPGDQVLQPGQTILLASSSKTDCIVEIEVTVVVGSERNSIPNLIAHTFDTLHQDIQSLVGNLNLCERVQGCAIRHRFIRPLPSDLPEIAVDYRVRDISKQFDTEVHLQEGESLLENPLVHTCRKLIFTPSLRCVCVQADLVSVFSSKQLITGHVISFAYNIPQSHLNGTNTSTLTGMKTKLLDPLEYHLHITGVHTEDAALEEHGITPGCSVTNFSQTVDALVGIDPDHRTACMTIHDNGIPHVGNLKIRRCRIAINFRSGLRQGIFHGAEHESAQHQSPHTRFLEKFTTSILRGLGLVNRV